MTRHLNNFGFKLCAFGNAQVELWICFSDIPPHYHASMDSRIVWLLGSMSGTRANRTKRFGWRDTLRSFKVPAGVYHHATCSPFAVFLNIEKWTTQPTSAAVDFHE